jgi:hypothetical protein
MRFATVVLPEAVPPATPNTTGFFSAMVTPKLRHRFTYCPDARAIVQEVDGSHNRHPVVAANLIINALIR